MASVFSVRSLPRIFLLTHILVKTMSRNFTDPMKTLAILQKIEVFKILICPGIQVRKTVFFIFLMLPKHLYYLNLVTPKPTLVTGSLVTRLGKKPQLCVFIDIRTGNLPILRVTEISGNIKIKYLSFENTFSCT